MSVPQLVLRRTAHLFISFAIALFYLEHDVAGAEYSVDVAAVVVDLVAYLDVGDGAVGAEGLEGAGADVEFLHDILAVEEIVYDVLFHKFVTFGW